MILVIDRSQKNASNVADMFLFMGVLSKAVTVGDAFSEINNNYRAVIMMCPESFPDAEDFIRRLRKYNSTVPIFAMGNPDKSYSHLFAHVFSRAAYASNVMAKILEYTLENDLPQPGDYKLAGIDVSCDNATPTYFWTPLPLTRTESMVVRYLIRTYPNPTSAEEILKYAFKESKIPELSNIRTHISIINKKFRNLANRNLIETSFGKGYRIMTPEVMAALV